MRVNVKVYRLRLADTGEGILVCRPSYGDIQYGEMFGEEVCST